jgi:hypothetical protein
MPRRRTPLALRIHAQDTFLFGNVAKRRRKKLHERLKGGTRRRFVRVENCPGEEPWGRQIWGRRLPVVLAIEAGDRIRSGRVIEEHAGPANQARAPFYRRRDDEPGFDLANGIETDRRPGHRYGRLRSRQAVDPWSDALEPVAHAGEPGGPMLPATSG